MDLLLDGLRIAAIVVFAGAMVWAAISDLRIFEVPNRVPAAIVLSFPLLVLGNGDGWDTVLNHALTGGIVLVVGFGLFVVRVIGAGDVKLLAAVSLWMGWPALVPYLFFVTLVGGVFAVLLILFRRLPLPNRAGAIGWVRRLHERKKDIPYAVAIALPALFMLPRLFLP